MTRDLCFRPAEFRTRICVWTDIKKHSLKPLVTAIHCFLQQYNHNVWVVISWDRRVDKSMRLKINTVASYKWDPVTEDWKVWKVVNILNTLAELDWFNTKMPPFFCMKVLFGFLFTWFFLTQSPINFSSSPLHVLT